MEPTVVQKAKAEYAHMKAHDEHIRELRKKLEAEECPECGRPDCQVNH